MLKKILLGLVILIGGFLAFAATRPSTYHVERSAKINAPASAVFAQLADFQKWGQWSPWDKLDPQMHKSYSGEPGTVGASYSWQGNSDVGEGKMTITELEPDKRIAYQLEFIQPFPALAKTQFTLAPAGQGATTATWAMDGTNGFMSKVFGIFMDMDKMIGADFEKGLAALDGAAQAQARQDANTAAAP